MEISELHSTANYIEEEPVLEESEACTLYSMEPGSLASGMTEWKEECFQALLPQIQS